MKSLFTPFTSIKAIHYIILIGFIVFGNVFFNNFVWDDKTYILNNPEVHSINVIGAFQRNFFNTGGQYRPIPVIYFSALYSLFNTHPFFYHFFQITLHITNAVLVFLLFKQFFKKPLAFFLTLVFLVHPLAVESVAYIGATGNTLFFFFGLSALLLSRKLNASGKLYPIVGCLLLLSLFSKETGILLLAMTLVYAFLFRKETKYILLLTSICTLAVYCVMRFFVGNVYFEKLDMVAIARLSFGERMLHIPSVIFYYLKMFFYPGKLAIGQEWILNDITLQNFYYPLIVECALLLASILYAGYLFKRNNERYKVFLFFTIWLLSGLILHSQIFPLDWTVADRWFYFSIVGLVGMIGVLLQSISSRKRSTIVGYGFALLVLTLLSLRTMVRNTNWVDAITLYTHDSTLVDSWDIENNLGFEYKFIDNQPEALKHYLKANKLFPFESTYLNVGIVYGNMGNHQKAIEYYSKALAAKKYPTSSHKHNLNTYSSTINVLLVTERTTEAKKVAEEALSDYPDSPELWAELAIIQQWMHEDDAALESATRAKELGSTQFTNFIYDKIVNKQKIHVSPAKNAVNFL